MERVITMERMLRGFPRFYKDLRKGNVRAAQASKDREHVALTGTPTNVPQCNTNVPASDVTTYRRIF